MFDAIWSYFSKGYGWDVLHRMYYRECVAYLQERGVSHIVYSNYAHKKGVARALNRWNLEILDEIPELYCFAAYHPDDEDALAMARDVLQHPRVLGFKLQLLVQRFYPHDERLFPMYELVMERGKRLLLHTGTGPVGNEFVGAAHFGALMERYPALPANVAHMGALEYAAFMEFLDKYPGLYMDTSFSFLPGLGRYFDLGADSLLSHSTKILYGSDFPNVILPRENEIDTLLAMNLPQDFYDRVFYRNGLALLPA